MNRVLVLLFSFLMNQYACQMINNEYGHALTETPFFNEKYVRSLKLKSIIGTISSKKELGSIRNTSKKDAYIFDQNGNLTIHYLTTSSNSVGDTSFTFYEYNQENKNIIMRMSDPYGFYSYTKNYNNEGKLYNQIYSREKNASNSKMNFNLDQRVVIFEESYLYEENDSILIITTLNSNQRPYQEQTYYYNHLNYLAQIQTKLLISNKVKFENYQYNDKGFLKSIQYFKQETALPKKEIRFDYDEWGNITFIDEYKDNVRVIHKELLYDPSTLILKTILSQDLVSNLITIIKYKPDFYD